MVRDGRRGQHLDTCRASASPRLGFGGAGVVASVRVSPTSNASGQKASAASSPCAGVPGKKSRGMEVRWGMTGGARLSAARALGRPLATRGWGARAGPRARCWATGYARVGCACWAARGAGPRRTRARVGQRAGLRAALGPNLFFIFPALAHPFF